MTAEESRLILNMPTALPRRRSRLRRLIVMTLGCTSTLVVCLALTPLALVFMISRGNPDPLQENFTPDVTSAGQYEQAYATSVAAAYDAGESFTITFTDAQFASWLDLRYQQATGEEIADIELLDQLPLNFTELQNIQVAFQGGQMSLYGEVPVSKRLTLSMALMAQILPDAEHHLNVVVISAQIGSVEMPDDIKADLAEPILDALTQNLDIEADYQVDSVIMSNGDFTIAGHITSPLSASETQESDIP